ncbi:MAG: putative RNA methyltransferase [Lawsonibacter sp.]|jgi:23S rRNA (guanine745-N1)-methyltransferase
MESLFCCPLCSAPLVRKDGIYRCPKEHCFDVAAAGYTHLLPANRKHSQNPGDDKEMVAARSAFLEQGYYAPLLQALCQGASSHIGNLSSPVILDSGCGEGYYTAGLAHALAEVGSIPRLAGIDLSKYALRRAAKRLPQGEFAVASAYHLPLLDSSVDLLVDIFSPLALQEFWRVLRPGGLFCYAVPSARHLWELKQILYPNPYENPVKREEYPGFLWLDVQTIRGQIFLKHSGDIQALFGMTPYAWKTPQEGRKRLQALETLDTTIGFDLHWYQKCTP